MDIWKPKHRLCPQLRANIFSKIFFWWTKEFIYEGLEKEYETDDLPQVHPELQTQHLGTKLTLAWFNELEKNIKNPSLLNAVLNVFQSSILKYSLVTIFQDCICRCAMGPAIVVLLNYFSGVGTMETGIYGGISLILLAFIYTGIKHLNFYNWDILGVKIRIALTSLVYSKGLKLSQKSLGSASIGEVTNLLSNDINRFDRGFREIPYVVGGPLQAGLITGILVYYIGVSAFFGLCVLLLMIPVQSAFARLIGRIRVKNATQTDRRIKLMVEVINGIQLIKMSAWEKQFIDYIRIVRGKEMKWIQRKFQLLGIGTVIMFLLYRVMIFVILIGFVKLSVIPLSPSQAFLLITLANFMRISVTVGMPRGVTLLSEIKEALIRIEKFLLLEENPNVKPNIFSSQVQNPRLEVKNILARWNDGDKDSLSNISFSIVPSSLLVVVGPVGSGKSALIQAILQELPLVSGSIEIEGKIAYVPQNPWIFNGSIKENILFGLPYHDEWFYDIIEACELSSDIQNFPYKENTINGDRGITLSGGQKTRINIARALYANADIYLLDDPFSALDARVGHKIFKNVIEDILIKNGKCVLLVTHLEQYLNSSTQVLILGNEGKVVGLGKYFEVKDTLERLNRSTSQLVDRTFILGDPTTSANISESDYYNDSLSVSATIVESKTYAYGTFPETTEFRNKGRISLNLYWKYFASGNQIGFVLLQFLFLFLMMSGYGICDYWIKIWTGNNANQTTIYYIQVYSILLGLSFLASILYYGIFVNIITNSSRTLHDQSLVSVLSAPMKFFEINSYGRVFNRFANDVGIIDDNLPQVYNLTVTIFANLLVSLVLVSISSPFMIFPGVGVIILVFLIRQTFLRPTSSLKRLESTLRSPIFGLVNTSLGGLSVIRAFGVQKQFLSQLNQYQDSHSSALYMYLGISFANGALVDWIGNLYLMLTLLSFSMGSYDAASVGLAISSALLMHSSSGSAVTHSIDLDSQIVSVERISEYAHVEPEYQFRRAPNADWPALGKIEFRNVCVRYGNEKLPVLNDITLLIQPKEKIGIVGRTGAGKSSLIATIFRLVEPYSGKIHIDGCDISQIGLYELRKKISIIPQSPILFIGTVRRNLDPLGIHGDEELWNVIKDVHLDNRIQSHALGLDSDITEGGGNFSEGEKQLLCLGRASLNQNKILILDEASANIDTNTDALIQETIRAKFRDCTILTIAHRLDTVMDSDRICVLEAGRIIECDEPWNLLQNPGGYLFNLCRKTGPDGFAKLANLANRTHLRKFS